MTSSSTRRATTACLTAIAVATALLLSSCTITWEAEASGSTHSGTCRYWVHVQRDGNKKRFVVEGLALKGKDASGVTCSISGTVWFSDGTTRTVSRVTNGTFGGYHALEDADAAMVKARFSWTASYYGDQQDSGKINYG